MIIQITGTGKIDEKTNSDTLSSALCIFKNGITATISASDMLDWHWQFTIYGTKGTLDVLTNPWLPEKLNKFSIRMGDKTEVIEFKAEQPLYTYQIDCVSNHVLNKQTEPKDTGVTWEHTLGNVDLLEKWISQVKMQSMKEKNLEIQGQFCLGKL